MRTYGTPYYYRRYYSIDGKKKIARVAIFIAILFLILSGYHKCSDPEIGEAIDSYRGVAIYYNGNKIDESHGQNYSEDGYYYGQKWQCVEFAKRFYFDALNHRMPDTLGNAKDFWDTRIPSGSLNHRRGLLQYKNGGTDKPQLDDLLVFTYGQYGHVAIISKVGEEYIEVVQQNVEGHPRQVLSFASKSGHYYIGDGKQPVGWLRVERQVIKP